MIHFIMPFLIDFTLTRSAFMSLELYLDQIKSKDKRRQRRTESAKHSSLKRRMRGEPSWQRELEKAKKDG